jgi:hypothetical protein
MLKISEIYLISIVKAEKLQPSVTKRNENEIKIFFNEYNTLQFSKYKAFNID